MQRHKKKQLILKKDQPNINWVGILALNLLSEIFEKSSAEWENLSLFEYVYNVCNVFVAMSNILTYFIFV